MLHQPLQSQEEPYHHLEVFTGTDQTISGSTTFYAVTKNTTSTALTLTFTSGTTQTINNTSILQGASGANLQLRSSSSGTQWSIDMQGTQTLGYIDVQDSNNTNATNVSCTTNCADSGNNTKWTFGAAAASGSSTTPASTSGGGGGGGGAGSSAPLSLTSVNAPLTLLSNQQGTVTNDVGSGAEVKLVIPPGSVTLTTTFDSSGASITTATTPKGSTGAALVGPTIFNI